MKINHIIVLALLLLVSCNHGEEKDTSDGSVATQKVEVPPFPVTDYLLGQIREIQDKPVTLLKTTTQDGVVDSSWVDRKEIKELAKDFLSPVIDSVFLSNYFEGNSFEDLTINAITFTYSVKTNSAKSGNLQQIDVYVKKDNSQVSRIYLVKNAPEGQLQLMWKSDHWFTIRKIKNDTVSEEKVQWNFDE